MSYHETYRKAYENLHNHMKYHDVKGWLLAGCIFEDAKTIGEAVKNVPEHRLKRRLARALLKDVGKRDET